MAKNVTPHIPDPQRVAEAGRYFRYMAEFVGFGPDDAEAIRRSGLVVEKHLPEIIGKFYANLLQYPPTRQFFLRADGAVDQAYLELRMYHQANFWRRTARGEYDDEYAGFVDYVGRAHTSRGADSNLYIAERYVIGMVGFVQHAIIDALQRELREYDPLLEMDAVKAWNKLCMVLLEVLARAYGDEHQVEDGGPRESVDPQEMIALSVQSYEKGLGIRHSENFKEVTVASQAEIPDGERKIVEVDGASIGVFHHQGEWYALRNTCLHRGGPVCTGKLDGNNLICPWHGYTYNLINGQLLLDPTAKLEMYSVILRDGEVRLRVPVRSIDELLTATLPKAVVSRPAQPAVEDITRFSDYHPTSSAAEPQISSVTTISVDAPASPRLAPNEFRLADIAPGKIKLVFVAGQRVAVYNLNGEYSATAEECTHAGGPLSEGELKDSQVICPWHDSCFDVRTGAVTCPPAEEPLKTYRVEIHGEIGRVIE